MELNVEAALRHRISEEQVVGVARVIRLSGATPLPSSTAIDQLTATSSPARSSVAGIERAGGAGGISAQLNKMKLKGSEAKEKVKQKEDAKMHQV